MADSVADSMVDTGDRYVVPGPDGGWDVVRSDPKRASGHFPSAEEAVNRAREIVEITGHGVGAVRIEGDDGLIRVAS